MFFQPRPAQRTARSALLCGLLASASASANTPDSNLQLPSWLSLSGTLQTRAEFLHQDFDSGEREDHALVERTTLRADLDFEHSGATVELADSRIFWVEDDTPVNNAMVNPLDILQGYVWFGGEQWQVKLGRFTQDIGSRRFMARNRYRNTINAFDGVNARWQLGETDALRVFYSLPVQRLYNGDPRDNKMKSDRSYDSQQFGGLVYERGGLPFDSQGELYLLTLKERDSADLQTRNRELYSLGARWLREPNVAQWDHELEVLQQEGRSRRSSAAIDTASLDHSASFLHAELGYTFEAPWQPRLQVHYDYASGDRDPTDDENNGLDSLFGVPRGDFGPTGIYRILVRNNISSPALRLELQPAPNWRLNMELRDAWLATASAPSPSSGLNDTTPSGDKHLGSQLETVLRWQVIPSRLRLESGFTYFNASNALQERGIDDKYYLYLQANLTF
ncbi:alginate export family protein [Parahaliea mediterranea]|uniref:alginate export family protein n=1 Tax=Parahaliea mediterranea TaxID=651086 RepID=UPI001300A319|nr:alginate export family protein [Parahaliea mediterranea]